MITILHSVFGMILVLKNMRVIKKCFSELKSIECSVVIIMKTVIIMQQCKCTCVKGSGNFLTALYVLTLM